MVHNFRAAVALAVASGKCINLFPAMCPVRSAILKCIRSRDWNGNGRIIKEKCLFILGAIKVASSIDR